MNRALYGEVLVDTIHTTSGRCVVLEAIAPGLEPVEGAGLSILLSAERAALLIDPPSRRSLRTSWARRVTRRAMPPATRRKDAHDEQRRRNRTARRADP